MAALLGLATASQAQNTLTLTKTLSKSELVPGGAVIVTDDVYYDNALKAKLEPSYPTKNIITLSLSETKADYPTSSFSATAIVKISYKGTDDNTYSIQDTLSINYDTSATYKSRNSFVFANSHWVKLELVSLASTNAAFNKSLVLTNEMQISRVYKFDPGRDTAGGIKFQPAIISLGADQVQVTWNAVIGADEYDLEWAYVDSSAILNGVYGNPIDPVRVFRNNASRVTVTDNKYDIPLMYDNGGVLFARVRAVQVKVGNKRTESYWSPSFARAGFRGHENALNWQSTISFAEEGKRKVIMQYFDGIMNSRQTVTKDNTTNKTIIAETFYDKQGRPAIQVLPTPSLSNIISYTRGFNTGVNGTYDVSKYDTLSSPAEFLSTSAAPMDSSSGASRYYSGRNDSAASGINRYIPNAGGYPFAETVYTPDNTGRISRQSGVGPDHTINSNHETKYFYGTPSQNELDRLFGTEAGDASHYFKNAVRDANGQYSVTYLDMHGRTIATALAGRAAAANLDKLPSDTALPVVDTISGYDRNDISSGVMTIHKSLVVPVDGQYDFIYAVPTRNFALPVCNYDGGNTSLLVPVFFKLEIKITDDQFNQLLPGKQPLIYNAVNNDGYQDTLRLNFSVYLKAGTYEITKTLKVNQERFEFYRNSYLREAVCYTLESLIDEQRRLQSHQNCIPDCQSCISALGDRKSFATNFMQKMGQPLSDSVKYRGEIDNAYLTLLADCDKLCGKNTLADSRRSAMLGDMTPPSGQYANIYDQQFKYSIFYTDGNNISPIYKRDEINYLGSDGKPALVYDETTGQYVRPQALLPQQFIEKFQPSWATALLPYHPEYCKLVTFETFKPSLTWDFKFRSTDTYQEALTAGFLNPAAGQGGIFAPYQQSMVLDSLAIISTQLRTEILDRMKEDPNNMKWSLYKVAAVSTFCRDSADTECPSRYPDSQSIFGSGLCKGDLDMLWRNFREQYLSLKQSVIDKQLSNVVCQQNGGNVNIKMLYDSGKVVHFATTADAFASEGLSEYLNKDNKDRIKDSARVIPGRLYEENCKTYISTWTKQLQQGGYSENEISLIIPQLLEICKAGSDVNHPYGASSVPKSNTTLYNRSFEDVIRNHNNTHPGHAPTTQFLITVPAPYYAQSGTSDRPVFTKPEDCECAKLDSARTEYAWAKVGQETFAEYLFRTSKVKISQIDLENMIAACHPTSSSCVFLEKVLSIPPVFQCYTPAPCTNCKVINQLITSYQQNFGDAALPVLPGKPNAPVLDSVQQVKADMFAAYMNNRLGYALSYIEYLNFKDSCDILQFTDSVITKRGNTINIFQLTYQGTKVPVYITDVKATKDSNFVLAGITKSDMKPVLVKVNSKGSLLWSKIYNSFDKSYITNVVPLHDGGTLVAGYVYQAPVTGTPNLLGSVQAKSTMKSVADSSGVLTQRTDSSGLSKMILNAEVPSATPEDNLATIFIKVRKDGSIEWNKIRLNEGTHTGYNVRDIIELSNNDIAYIGGYDATSFSINSTMGLLDSNGNEKWMKHIEAAKITQNIIEDGNDLVVSALNHSGSYFSPLIMKFNKVTGAASGSGQSYDFGSHTVMNDLYVGAAGGYVAVLTKYPDISVDTGKIVVFNLNSNLSVNSAYELSNPLGKGIVGAKSVRLADGSLLISQFPRDGINGGYVLKWNSNNTVAWARRRLSTTANSVIRLMPNYDGTLVGAGDFDNNPAVYLYDKDGRLMCDDIDDNIQSKSITASSVPVTLQPSDMGAGVSVYSTPEKILAASTTMIDCVGKGKAKTKYLELALASERSSVLMTVTDVKKTFDNNYVIAGNTKSGSRPVLVKKNANGDLLWARIFDPGYEGYITNVLALKDGNLLLAGYINKAATSTTSATSMKMAQQKAGDTSFMTRAAAAAAYDQSAVFIKVSNDGQVIWSKMRPNAEYTTGINIRDVTELSNGDIAYIGGYDAASSSLNGAVGVLDQNGSGKWMMRMTGLNITQQIIEDGNNLVISSLWFNNYYFNPGFVKLSKQTGSLISHKEWSVGQHTEMNGLYLNPAGGYKVAVTRFNHINTKDGIGVILNLDTSLALSSAYMISKPGKFIKKLGTSMNSDGSMFISQLATDDINAGFVLKLNSNNTVAWSTTSVVGDTSLIVKLLAHSDGSLIGVGHRRFNPALFAYNGQGRQLCDDQVDTVKAYAFATDQGATTPSLSALSAATTNCPVLAKDCIGTLKFIECTNTGEGGIPTTVASLYRGPLLCPQATPSFPKAEGNTVTSCTDSSFFLVSTATEILKAKKDSVGANFNTAYQQEVLKQLQKERFTVSYIKNEYHYTLYYYDQAGNLVKTVPPAGVVIDTSRQWLDDVVNARKTGTVKVPAHFLATSYRYNTLNQVVSQQSPDGGKSKFWYDRLGRVAVSQNAEQRKANNYSYTLYDELGRITEVGQLRSATAMTDIISRNSAQLQQWVNAAANTKEQVTVTVYDKPNQFDLGVYITGANLRNRVSYHLVYDGNPAANILSYNNGTFYNYDIHGNVDTLIQDFKLTGLGASTRNRIKTIAYNYDLISGKVNKVSYQPGSLDAFYHRYTYDAENRLTDVETSRDDVYWEKEAFYKYYAHGPLARAVIGQQQVQGIDYAYTLQGWLKGVNGSALSPVFDMGGDGASNSSIAKDAFGYSLHYYGDRDYKAIGGVNLLGAGAAGPGNNLFNPLYNGNIAAMGVNIAGVDKPLLYNYQYDVLNRLTKMTAASGLNTTTNQWSPVATSDFKEQVTYDGNGNIQSYLRNGNGTATGKLAMDNLTYKYLPGTNQLDHIRDVVAANSYATDIDDMSAGNYSYDAIGNLVKDVSSGLDSVKWTVYGKIKRIYKKGGTVIDYTYDAAGNRIGKKVNNVETWYVKDATGNTLGIYTKNPAINSGTLTLTETSLYGSSRLGTQNEQIKVENVTTGYLHNLPTLGVGINTDFNRGNKIFELSNHLGNVLATISDRKRPISLNGTDVDHFEPVITTSQDYYPFGMLMPGRSGYAIKGGWISGTNDVNGYTLPVTLSIDTRTTDKPVEYVASGAIEFKPGFTTGDNDAFQAYIADGSYAGGSGGANVLEGGAGYRFGFNGKENDNEVKGEGNEIAFEARVYDPRVGRFLSVDPLTKKYPEFSPYLFANNSPISLIDVLGKEGGPGGGVATLPEPPTVGGRVYLNNTIDGVRFGSYAPQRYTLGSASQGGFDVDSRNYLMPLIDRVPPYGSITMNPDGNSITVWGANGNSWIESLGKRDKITTTISSAPKALNPNIVYTNNIEELEKQDSRYEYYYRAMSLTEFKNTKGFISVSGDRSDKIPFITANMDYVRNSKSFVWSQIKKYDILIRYKVDAGTFDRLLNASGDAHAPNMIFQARSNNFPIMKYEAYNVMIGNKLYKNDQNINFGFPGYSGSIYFNWAIKEMTIIDMSSPGVKK
ncbi:RHS repeat protein [Chitinophaga terrae (ex Kim and Jung 2007)]|uniref:RHS repeat protein n=1 Tax=Chitinophaga terrae (ex Kim and Jung 2007) TaxID=408074 RepID=UPI00111337CA|nr:RHS repeat-associated core domain-containing protein [Chitinophaga terrae (ex Kim and Jung 2007)]